MGGLARAAREGRLIEPRWLIGGAAQLSVEGDRVTAWLLDLSNAATRARAEAIALLPGEAAGFAHVRDAGERLLRRRLTRALLAAAGGCRGDQVAIDRTPLGAPVVAAPAGWHVGVAARWPACLIAVARVPLGVDLERVEPALPPARDLLTPAERDALDAAAPADRPRLFARAWATKEAHAKRFGDPRRADPATIDTIGARVTSPFGATTHWHRDADDLVAAIAI